MSESNVNGEASMKATKNPGKLNTSFWEQQASGGDAKPKPKRKTKHKKKKSKSSMASMWETKLAKQREEVESTAFPKSTVSTISENADPNSSPKRSPSGSPKRSSSGSPKTSSSGSPGTKSKVNVSALAVSEPAFSRPLIPSTARKPKNVTKKNIIEMSHEEVKQKLREYLSASFQYDARMIMDEVVLCVYLRDVAGIDLSAMGDIKWDYQTLLDATKDVFGVKAINTWGYTLRVM